MTCPLEMLGYSLIEVSKIDVGSGWYYAIIGKIGDQGLNQQFLKDGSRRVLINIWCYENVKGKWIIDDNGVLFSDEEDAVLFKMASPYS